MIVFTVNSFPRSGTNFFKKALAIAYDQDTVEYMHLMDTNHEISLFYEKEKRVITILRDPREAIVSAITRGYVDDQEAYEGPKTIDGTTVWWIQIANATLENINDIYPILFEDFVEDLEKVIQNISISFNVPLNTKDIYNKTKNNLRFAENHEIQISSKSSNFYNIVNNDYDKIDNDVIDNIYSKYYELKDAIIKRQTELGWL